jgi:mannose-1-phosphate guanylyltransferase
MAKISEKSLKKHLYVSILCGGVGKRLWPRSRKKTPKQFIDLFDNGTVFQKTVKRAKSITTPDKIFVVTSQDYVNDVLTQDRDLLLRNIIAEPMGKDTALAMTAVVAYIYKRDPKAIIINLASDAAISSDEVFRKDMILAAKAAWETKMIVTVGIKPAYPHTGYGYIKAGRKKIKANGKSVYNVLQFTEKPNLKTAKRFLKTGQYYWNANLYTWRADVILETASRVAPKLSALIQRIQKSIGQPQEAANLRRVYQDAEKVSIDYAISEKTDNLVLFPASFGWDDIGDWSVVYERSKQDKEGNAIIRYGQKGDYVVLEAQNNLIHFNNKLLALVGVDDLIVVDTDDALLICHREQAQKVKPVVQKIKKQGGLEYL